MYTHTYVYIHICIDAITMSVMMTRVIIYFVIMIIISSSSSSSSLISRVVIIRGNLEKTRGV